MLQLAVHEVYQGHLDRGRGLRGTWLKFRAPGSEGELEGVGRVDETRSRACLLSSGSQSVRAFNQRVFHEPRGEGPQRTGCGEGACVRAETK